MSFLPYAVAAWICIAGLYGIVTSNNLIHLALCLSVTQSSTYVLLLAIGYVEGGGPPIFKGIKLGTTSVDPVVQSLALTDIVVSVTVPSASRRTRSTCGYRLAQRAASMRAYAACSERWSTCVQ